MAEQDLPLRRATAVGGHDVILVQDLDHGGASDTDDQPDQEEPENSGWEYQVAAQVEKRPSPEGEAAIDVIPQGRVHHEALPDQRVVIRFDFHEGKGTYWLILKVGDISVCTQDPGFEVDVTVSANLAALFEVWLGRTTLHEEQANGRVCVTGPPTLPRALPSWLALAPIASAVRRSSR